MEYGEEQKEGVYITVVLVVVVVVIVVVAVVERNE